MRGMRQSYLWPTRNSRRNPVKEKGGSMGWRDGVLPEPLQVTRRALLSFASGVLFPALFVLLNTASIAVADVHSLTPSIASASIVIPDDSQSPACQSLECVHRRLHASTTLRLEGDFGRFMGRVTRWDADSLATFEVDPDWGGTAPVAPISWSQISRVDQRVSNSARGAVIGAITLGAMTALFAATVSAASNVTFFGANPDANHEVSQAALKGALIGGAVGAGIGAGIGATSNHWILIYQRR